MKRACHQLDEMKCSAVLLGQSEVRHLISSGQLLK